MSDKQLIPFSKELWETGEYEAVNKRNEDIKIYEIDIDGIIFGKLNDNACNWKHDGKVFYQMEDWDTLMLRKKTKKVWIAFLDGMPYFETRQGCEAYYGYFHNFSKAMEIEI